MRHPLPLMRPLLWTVLASVLVVPVMTQARTPLASSPAIMTVVVNTRAVVRLRPRTFFGVNYQGFWEASPGSTASAVALAQTPIRAVRFPGGVPADWYDWQDPYYKKWSTTGPLDLWRYARRFGATPLFQTNYMGNLPPPPRRSYAVNTPQNAAAWVLSNKNQGIPARMEVGNEEDVHMASHHDNAFRRYGDAFNAQARAMHAADHTVQVFGPAGTNEYYWWALDSLGMFLQQTGNRTGTGQVDGVSVHYYTGNGWHDTIGLAQHWAAPGGPWQFIQKTIQANDTRNLPVDISEWNVGTSDKGNGFNPTLGHGLVLADMLGAFALSGVAEEDYFKIHAAQSYGLLYGDGESRPVDSPTPNYYATVLWGKMGTALLSLRQSADPATTVSTYAAKKADGSVQVMAINKTGTAQPLTVRFQGFNPRGGTLHIDDLTGASGTNADLDALYNGVVNPSPQTTLPGLHVCRTVAGSTITYTLPGYSVTALDVAPRSEISRPAQSCLHKVGGRVVGGH